MSNLQVKPKTDGWTQKKDESGKPLLQFAEPKRGKPPLHLADIEGFRAKVAMGCEGADIQDIRGLTSHHLWNGG